MIIRKLGMAFNRFGTLAGTNHKPYLIILWELLAWVITNRGGINVYFDYELYLTGKKSADYVKEPLFKKIEIELNSPTYYPILEDKYMFHQMLEGHEFRSPVNLFLVDPSGIYNFKSGKQSTQDEFLQKDFDGFCKLVNGFGGKMIFRLKLRDKSLFLDNKEIPVSEFFHFLGNRKFLIQERIIQHAKLDLLNPSCINTLRMLTLREGQSYHFFSGFMRIGINNSIVDNLAQGNLTVGIEKESGRLLPLAYSAKTYSEQDRLDRHPQTQTIFKDFEIPYFEGVRTPLFLLQIYPISNFKYLKSRFEINPYSSHMDFYGWSRNEFLKRK